MTLPREPDASGKVDDALKLNSEDLHAGHSVALARQETAKPDHQAHYLIQSGWGHGYFLAIQDLKRLPLIPLGLQRRIWIGAVTPKQPEPGNPPGHHHVQRQSSIQPFHRTQLQSFQAKGIHQVINEQFDFPAHLLSHEQYSWRFKSLDRSVRQQHPFHWCPPFGSVFFTCHRTAHLNPAALTVHYRRSLDPDALPHIPRLLSLPRRHRETDNPHHLATHHPGPQLDPFGQRPVMLRAVQPVGWIPQVAILCHQGHDISHAFRHIDQPAVRKSDGHFSNSGVAFRPAGAFQRPPSLAVLVVGYSRPHPGIQVAKWLPVWRDSIIGMQIQAARRFIGERPQTRNPLTIEVQFRGVLQPQDNTMRGHPHLGACPVRREDAFPFAFVLRQKAIRHLAFRPAATRLRNACQGVCRKKLHKTNRPLDQALLP